VIKKVNLLQGFILVVAEILIIAYLDYVKAQDYISLDVFYCLPVIQAARLGAVHAMRRSDSHVPDVIAIVAAVAWSAAEAAIIWPDFPLSVLALNVFTRSVTFTVIGRVVAKLMRERARGRRDALTHLYNRLEFFERFEIERSRSERSGKPYSLLFVDIDRFKNLNDELGHLVGDEALKLVAEVLRENSRAADTACRFGGDEFALLFPETDEATCTMLVNRIKLESAREFLQQGWPISLSIGHVTETGKRHSADQIVHMADARMYASKRAKQ
jgi:diguanylate cyclase (GGDEF)-like protein